MRDEKFPILKILILAIAFSACQKNFVENEQVKSEKLPSVSPTLNISSTPAPETESPIRKINFRNFTYSETKDYPYPETFTLKNGEKPYVHMKEAGINLDKVIYSDLTENGEEEAILTMSIQTGGSAMPNLIYIYALKNDKPKMLWGFMTGDRAEGGLKKVYAENRELIVELFGDNKFNQSKKEFNFQSETDLKTGLCCPTAFTKFRFKWNGKKFAVKGKPEMFDYDWRKEMNKHNVKDDNN